MRTRPPARSAIDGGREACTESGRGDDVVAARMADARQRVVLAEHSDVVARRRPTVASNAVSMS